MKKSLLVSAVLCALSTTVCAAEPFMITHEQNEEKTFDSLLEIQTDESAIQINENIDNGPTGGSLALTAPSINLSSTAADAIAVFNGGALSLGSAQTELISISSSGNDCAGIFAKNYGTSEGASVKVEAQNIVINAKTAGIWTQNNTEKTERPENGTSVILKAKDSISIKAEDGGIYAFSNSLVDLSAKNISIEAKHVIDTRGNSVVNINKDGTGTVKLKGDIVFETPGKTDKSGETINAEVNVNLVGKGSVWEGNSFINYPDYFEEEDKLDKTNVTDFSVSLTDGAKWVPTQVKEVSKENDKGVLEHIKYQALNNLAINGGIVDINEGVSVTVETMTGTGTINLATDGTTAGEFNVKAADEKASLSVNLMDTKLEKQLTADEINAEQAKKLMANVGGTDGKNVVSTSTAVPEGMVNPAFGVDAEGKTHEASANTLMQSSLELASAAPLALNRIMMNDVRKRLGDIRTTEGTHGAWVRYDGGKLSGEGGLENDFHTVQVGIDTVPTADSARMGVAFSYTDSDAEYARGSADMKAYSIAMYGTKVFDNGMFVDVIGRMGTADSDLTVDGQHKGTLDNVVLGVSGEFGWRFDVTNSMYIEPQAELSYAYVNGDKLTLGTAEYDVDSVNSLLGRVGFAAGLKCPSDMGNVYVRASAVHEFLGDSKITGANAGHTNVYEIDGKDTWVEYGLGANFNVTKSTYMWADVERTTGGALDEDWRATVGVRYAW